MRPIKHDIPTILYLYLWKKDTPTGEDKIIFYRYYICISYANIIFVHYIGKRC